MELRRAADALVRCQASPMAALLSPSAVRWQAGRQLISQSRPQISNRRTFATTSAKMSFKPTATTTAAPTPPKPDEAPTQEKKPASTNVEDAARNLGWLQGNSSRFSPSSMDQKSRERELLMNGGSSASDLLRSMNKTFSPGSGRAFEGIDISRMQNPSGGERPQSAAELMRAINTSVTIPRQKRIPIRLSPSTGKTVNIGGNVDVARGLRLLEMSCSRNKVRRDANRQRFHERTGLKKKRLRSERWRRRFMEGFKATVGRVKQLRKQGW